MTYLLSITKYYCLLTSTFRGELSSFLASFLFTASLSSWRMKSFFSFAVAPPSSWVFHHQQQLGHIIYIYNILWLHSPSVMKLSLSFLSLPKSSQESFMLVHCLYFLTPLESLKLPSCPPPRCLFLALLLFFYPPVTSTSFFLFYPSFLPLLSL